MARSAKSRAQRENIHAAATGRPNPAPQVKAGEQVAAHPVAHRDHGAHQDLLGAPRQALGLARLGGTRALAPAPVVQARRNRAQAPGVGGQSADGDRRRAARFPPLVEPGGGSTAEWRPRLLTRPPSRAIGLTDAVGIPPDVEEAGGPDEAEPDFSRCGRRGRRRSPGIPARGRCDSRSRRGPPSRPRRARHNSRGPRRR